MKKRNFNLEDVQKEALKKLYDAFGKEVDLYLNFRKALDDILNSGQKRFPFYSEHEDFYLHAEEAMMSIEANIYAFISDQMENLFVQKIKKKDE